MKIVSLLLFLLSTSVFAQDLSDPAGRVISLEGEAQIQDKPAAVGDVVYPKNVVATGADSKLKLYMVDKSVLDLGPNSKFQIGKYELKDTRDVDVNLEMGSIRALVQKKLNNKGRYLIRTKTSVFAVRGTELVVVSGQPGTQTVHDEVTVSDGKVEISRGSEQAGLLVAGQQWVSDGTASGSRTVDLNPQDLMKRMNGFRMVDGTFRRELELFDGKERRGIARVKDVGGGNETILAAANAFSEEGLIQINTRDVVAPATFRDPTRSSSSQPGQVSTGINVLFTPKQ